MKDIPKFAFILTLVALIATGSLAWINKITRPLIAAQEKKEFEEALTYVLPGTDSTYVEVFPGDSTIYFGYSDSTHTILTGYAFLIEPQGYVDKIKTLIGVDTAGQILAIKILSSKESPGYGDQYVKDLSWQKNFSGQNATEIRLNIDDGSIDSFSGATITASAITDGIRQGAEAMFQKIIQQSKFSDPPHSSVLPGAEHIIKSNLDDEIYECYSDPEHTQLVGYAFIVESKGYHPDIKIKQIVGINPKGKILAIKTLEHSETSGYGSRCMEIRIGDTEPWWLKQFIGKYAPPLKIDKDGGPIEAITSATITSRSITNGIAERSTTILKKFQK